MNVSTEKLKLSRLLDLPRKGTIDYAPVFKQLDYVVYRSAISLEIWNQVRLKEDPCEVVRIGFESWLRLERLWGEGN